MRYIVRTIIVVAATLALLVGVQAAPANAAAVDVRVASFNINGGYSTEGGTWKKRLPYVVKTMLAGGASIYALQEAHESASEHKQVLAEINRQSAASWALAVGKGGNHIIYKNKKHSVVSKRNVSLPHSRYYSEVRFKNLSTGIRFTVWNTHLTATMLPDRPTDVADAMRRAQAEVVADQLARLTDNVVGGGDLNDGQPDGVRAIFDAVGHHDVRTLTSDVTNAQWDSHELHYQPNKMRGRWIDYLGAGPSTQVNSAGLVDSVNASDHNLIWVSATF
jgi:endonuclease/exonuclease/phosphatase (EEP) superfamily protein YafD